MLIGLLVLYVRRGAVQLGELAQLTVEMEVESAPLAEASPDQASGDSGAGGEVGSKVEAALAATVVSEGGDEGTRRIPVPNLRSKVGQCKQRPRP